MHCDVCLKLLLLAVPLPTLADGAVLKNWFNDPFLQVRAALPACPTPLGPLATEADMRKEAHWRTERGNSCWVAGKCKRPNSYLYDADIARDLTRRFADSGQFRQASLWLTVQRRFVWVEGCAAKSISLPALERFIAQTPDVERVILNVTANPARPGYPRLP